MKGMESGVSSASGSGSGVHSGPHPKGTVIGGGVGGGVGIHGGVGVGVGGGGSSGDSGQSSGGSGSVSPTPRGHMNPHEMMDPLIVDTHHGMNSPGLSATSSCGKHDSGYITRTLQQQHQHLQLHRQQMSLQRLSKLSELFPLPNSYYISEGKTIPKG